MSSFAGRNDHHDSNAAQPSGLWRRRHRHNWSLIDKTVLPGKRLKNVKTQGEDGLETLRELLRDKVVLTFKCDCGKVRIECRQ